MRKKREITSEHEVTAAKEKEVSFQYYQGCDLVQEARGGHMNMGQR